MKARNACAALAWDSPCEPNNQRCNTQRTACIPAADSGMAKGLRTAAHGSLALARQAGAPCPRSLYKKWPGGMTCPRGSSFLPCVLAGATTKATCAGDAELVHDLHTWSHVH